MIHGPTDREHERDATVPKIRLVQTDKVQQSFDLHHRKPLAAIPSTTGAAHSKTVRPSAPASGCVCGSTAFHAGQRGRLLRSRRS